MKTVLTSQQLIGAQLKVPNLSITAEFLVKNPGGPKFVPYIVMGPHTRLVAVPEIEAYTVGKILRTVIRRAPVDVPTDR